MTDDLPVDPDALREQVRDKYREVAVDPGGGFHFHTGRDLARRLGYEAGTVDALPDRAVESFAGVGNPFSPRRLAPGEKVIDVGSGAGFDSFSAPPRPPTARPRQLPRSSRRAGLRPRARSPGPRSPARPACNRGRGSPSTRRRSPRSP